MAEIIIGKEQAEQRLDRFLKKQLPFSTVQRLIRKRLIRVNNKRQHADYRLVTGDVIQYPESLELQQERPQRKAVKSHIPSEWILFEDDDLLVLNKPTGIAVQGGTGIRFSIDDAIKSRPNAKLVHRLDKDTSGVLLVALNAGMARHLTGCFKNNTTHKTYIAKVQGIPKYPKGIIEAPLLKQAGVHQVTVSKSGKPATSHYKVMKSDHKNSWLELSPVTGRTHQLRVHCQYLGHPIIGDTLYGRKDSRLFLHAYQIKLPSTNPHHQLQFTAPLPAEFTGVFDE